MQALRFNQAAELVSSEFQVFEMENGMILSSHPLKPANLIGLLN